MSRPVFVSWGGGVNSTALIVEAARRGERIDGIAFADTGSEMPRTYAYLETFRAWLATHGLTLEVVRWVRREGEWAGRFVSLHEACLARGELPSRAYGLSGCTSKYKQQPLDAWVRARCPSAECERWIGYDAGEPRRVAHLTARNDNWRQGQLFGASRSASPQIWRAPLAEWGIGRAQCDEILKAAGLPSPGKSSCFICPSLRPAEVRGLDSDQLRIALEVERRGVEEARAVRGLGRNWSWSELVSGTGQPTLDLYTPEPCGACVDDSNEREEP